MRRDIGVVTVVLGAALAGTTGCASLPAAHQSQPVGAQTGAPVSAAVSPRSADQQKVAAAVQAALTADQQIMAGTPSLATGASPMAASSSALALRKRQAQESIDSSFAGAAAVKEEVDLDNELAREQSPDFVAGPAGIKNLTYTTLDATPSSATVHASVESWARFSMRDQKGIWRASEPHNVELVTMTLAKSATGKWLVQTYSWVFAQGSAP